jgi:hypothetical protein
MAPWATSIGTHTSKSMSTDYSCKVLFVRLSFPSAKDACPIFPFPQPHFRHPSYNITYMYTQKLFVFLNCFEIIPAEMTQLEYLAGYTRLHKEEKERYVKIFRRCKKSNPELITFQVSVNFLINLLKFW